MNIGEIIKNKREACGITQCELAEKACVTQAFISLLEQGKKSASTETLECIADALKCKIELVDI